MQKVSTTPNGELVFYGLQDGVPTLFLYTINGKLVTQVATGELLTSVACSQTVWI
jgi:hypothetical protein